MAEDLRRRGAAVEDVEVLGAVAGVAADVRSRLGRIDLVVIDAGQAAGPALFADAPAADWADAVSTVVQGTVVATRSFLDDLLDAAADGHVTDLLVLVPVGADEVIPRSAVQSAAAGAINRLTRTLRVEVGGQGLRVRRIEVGPIETRLGGLRPEHVAAVVSFVVGLAGSTNVAECSLLPTAPPADRA